MNRWLFWCAQHWSPVIGIFNWENRVKAFLGLGGPDPREVARGENEVARFGAVLDGWLADRQWVCGNDITLADFALGAPLAAMEEAKVPLQAFTHLQAWFARVRALPAWTRVPATL